MIILCVIRFLAEIKSACECECRRRSIVPENGLKKSENEGNMEERENGDDEKEENSENEG